MPRLSMDGDSITGVGNVPIGINGVTPAALAGFTGGGWSWMSNDVAMGQGQIGAGAWKLYTYTLSTLTLAEIDANPANETVAGGGHWAAWLAGDGVRTSQPAIGTLETAGLHDMSDLGLIATTGTRGVGPINVYLASSGALVRPVPTTITSPFIRVRGGALAYQDMAGWHVISVSSGRTVNGWAGRPDIYMVIPFLAGLRLWVAEYELATDTWAIRAVDGARGFVVPSGLVQFNPDIVALTDTSARLASSSTQGEAPGDLRLLDINLATGETSTWTVVAGVLTPAAGPTLVQTRFDTSQAARFYPPVTHQVLDQRHKTLMSVPWQAWARLIGETVAGVQTSVTGLPSSGTAAAAAAAPVASQTVEALDGTSDPGTSVAFARGDHKHGDANRPTDDEKAALAGTNGTPSGANPYVTDSDPRLGATGPHAATHEVGGGDEVDVTALAGFPGGGTTFLRDDGTFATPPGGSPTYFMSPLTTGGDPSTAELVFDPDGDVVMVPEYF